MRAFPANMQKKLKQHGTRAGPTTLSDERARGAEVAGVWVWRGVCVDRENDEWGPTVIEAKMVKIGHFTSGPMGIQTWVRKVSGRGFNHCARIGWSG